jgi:hypothetical protein
MEDFQSELVKKLQNQFSAIYYAGEYFAAPCENGEAANVDYPLTNVCLKIFFY